MHNACPLTICICATSDDLGMHVWGKRRLAFPLFPVPREIRASHVAFVAVCVGTSCLLYHHRAPISSDDYKLPLPESGSAAVRRPNRRPIAPENCAGSLCRTTNERTLLNHWPKARSAAHTCRCTPGGRSTAGLGLGGARQRLPVVFPIALRPVQDAEISHFFRYGNDLSSSCNILSKLEDGSLTGKEQWKA